MLYKSDYEITRVKEEQVRDHVRQAATDRLLATCQPDRAGWLKRSMRSMSHLLGHVFLGAGKRLENIGTSDSVLPHQEKAYR
jgi:hypothetical protein